VSEAGGTPPRVLYVDDDLALSALMRRGLSRRGFEVTCVQDGRRAVEVAAAEPFDVIAIDHYMPGQDGLETLDQLTALPSKPPVVYVTGSDESRIAVAALKAGAADYVVKTASDEFQDLLAAALSQAIEQVRLRRERDAAAAALAATNARLEALVSRQSVLLREVNHRVANSLQLIASLVHMQAMAVSDAAAKEALRDTQNRIAAIMQIHRRLYTSEDVQTVDMQEYLSGLIAELRQSMSAVGSQREIKLSADHLRLDTDRAVSLGVVVTELVTNACKYAYADGQPGEVRVSLQQDGAPGRIRLLVEDDGGGMPEGGEPKGTGLGQKVIGAMAKSLNSAVRFDPVPRGVRAVLDFAV
jgi:two-component sensor histidine kinase